jgi:hypothetical protein
MKQGNAKKKKSWWFHGGSQEVIPLSTSMYEVPSETRADTSYTVDMHLGSCTCKQGSTGGPCKHQSAVMMAFKERCNNFLPVNFEHP